MLEIETDRLLLRPHTLNDFDFSHTLWSDPKIFEFISGKPSSPAQSMGRLYNYLGHWQLRGYGYLLVELKSSHQPIGEVGLAQFKRDIHPPMDLDFEAGWVISPEHHGKGYAFEALQALLNWNFRRVGPYPVWCMIDKRNEASIKLAQKLKFEFTHEAHSGSEHLNVYQQTISSSLSYLKK